MSLLNHKNQFIASGAIESIEEVNVRLYTTKAGEQAEWKTRKFVVRNKFARRRVWQITDYEFEGTGDVVDALNMLEPGIEVIVNFSIRSRAYEKEGVKRRWTTLTAWNIISIKDKPVPEEWWLPKDREAVSGKETHSPSLPTIEEKRRRHPETKAYSKDTFSRTTDYSDKKEEDDLPF